MKLIKTYYSWRNDYGFFIISTVLFLNNFQSVHSEQCKQYFSLQPNTLIATKKSEANGAVFIKSKSTSTMDECYSLCCSIASCTVAVYENKDKRMCYLFNCWSPNVCEFVHDAYYATLVASNESPPNQASVVNQTTVIHDKASKANSQGTSTDKSPPAAKLKNLPPALLGESCGVNRQCHVKNAICASGKCVCDSGFIEKRSRCVESVCKKPDLMFQCDDTSKSPNCIAIYDRCNQIAECGDSSDELGCETEKIKTKDTSNSEIETSATSNSAPDIKMNNMGGVPHQNQGQLGNSKISNLPAKQTNEVKSKARPTSITNARIFSPAEKPLNRVRPYPGDEQTSVHSPEETRPLDRVRPYPEPQPQHRRPRPPMRNSPNNGIHMSSSAEKQLVQSHAPPKGKAPIQDILDREYGVMKGDPSFNDRGRLSMGDMRQGNIPNQQQRVDLWQQQPQSDYDSLVEPGSDSRWASGGPVISMPNNNRVGDYYFSGRDRYKPLEDEDWYSQDSFNANKYGRNGGSWLSSNRMYPSGEFDDWSLYPNYKDKMKYAPSKLTEHRMQHSKPKDETYLHGNMVSEDEDSAGNPEQSQQNSLNDDAGQTKNSEALSTDKSLLGIRPSDIKMLEQSNAQSRLAIVLLTIGLSVTILLVAVTCWRMKAIKRRFRRSGGKTLAADEAEHLMNGMYL